MLDDGGALDDGDTLLGAADTPGEDSARRQLVDILGRLTEGVEGSLDTDIVGLSLHRIMRPTAPKPGIQTPALALIAQGSKRVFIGDEQYEYDPLHYTVTSVDLPAAGKVTVASATEPYLGLRLDLDVEAIARLIQDENLPPAAHADVSRGLYVNRLSTTMLDAVLRLQEARRLMLLGNIDVAIAAHRVGYESASQFSREYSRFFGAPPLRDRRRWLQDETQSQD